MEQKPITIVAPPSVDGNTGRSQYRHANECSFAEASPARQRRPVLVTSRTCPTVAENEEPPCSSLAGAAKDENAGDQGSSSSLGSGGGQESGVRGGEQKAMLNRVDGGGRRQELSWLAAVALIA